MTTNYQSLYIYTIHDIIKPFDGVFKTGEYYIDEYVINKRLGKGIKTEAGFYSKQLVQALITKFKMPISNVKWYIQARKKLAPDTFKNYMLAIFSMFPEPQAKLLANSYIGELGRKYSRKDHGFTCSSLIQHNASGHPHLLRIVMLLLTVVRIQTLNKNYI